MKFCNVWLLFLSPCFLYSQKVTYRHPSIMGAGFFVNTFPEYNKNNSKILSPGIGVACYLPINKSFDYNINLNGSFTRQFKKEATQVREKSLLLETSGLIRWRMVGKPGWVQPFILSGLGVIKFKNNYVGFLPAGAGLQFNYKNIFLIPGTQYHLPFASSSNAYFHYNISVLGTISWKKQKPVAHKTTPAPNTPGDRDGDGIIDVNDVCPDVAGKLAFSGCPDSDNDGIQDKEDECPRLPGIAKYKGCPIPDTDKDGITDEEDSCISVPGVIQYKGCPIPDTDNDGLNDEQDSCVSMPGPKSNKGCPIVKNEVTEEMQKTAKAILFKTGSYEITRGSFPALDKVASILNENPDLNLLIEGHTDNEGTEQSNQQLSENRANAILNYLRTKGVKEARLKAMGYGQTKPIDSNTTSKGRAKNRRVELKLY